MRGGAFSYLGKIVAGHGPFFLGIWIILLSLVTWATPPWRTVAEDREFGFLPPDSPGRRGDALFKAAFPHQPEASNVVFVLSRSDGKLASQDWLFIDKILKPALRQIADMAGGIADQNEGQKTKTSDPAAQAQPQRSTVRTISTAKDPGTGLLLISPDHRATLVVVELTTEFMELRNRTIVRKFEGLLKDFENKQQLPSGLAIHLTGSATVGRDINVAQIHSAAITEIWTAILVIGLLLLIYRAPLLALVPLLTVFCALRVSLNLLSILAEAGVVTLFEGIQIYITIILYGSGVDYCLFLIARYREELESGKDARAALGGAVAKVGASLTASAATVMLGIGMMAFADFGKFHYAGLAISFSLFVGLCAVLTLGTSLLSLSGRWAFWPNIPSVPAQPASAQALSVPVNKPWSFWDRLAGWLLRRPGTIWLLSVALLMPFVVVAVVNAKQVNYDLLLRLPADAPSVVGTKALKEHFSSGTTGPITLVIYNPRLDFREDANEALIKKMEQRLRSLQSELGITDILSQVTPLGITKAGQVTTVDLAVPFPPEAVRIDPGPPLLGSGGGLGGGFLDLGENYHRLTFMHQKALEYYVSKEGALKGHVTQMRLLVEMNPLARTGADRLSQVEERVRKELPSEMGNDTQMYFIGPTADIRDLIDVTGVDETRIRALVTGCVFLILLILLRRFVVSIYLIASVLFSFFATLGATYAFFWALQANDFPGLDWKVSVLLFTVLVAIGEDYNIFLMTRVEEEQQTTSPEEGITRALVKTGHIITSCGLIMAGTFASLLAGSLVDLQQLGFALALGVLLDTFLVRPILVPAFLILLQRVKSRLTMNKNGGVFSPANEKAIAGSGNR